MFFGRGVLDHSSLIAQTRGLSFLAAIHDVAAGAEPTNGGAGRRPVDDSPPRKTVTAKPDAASVKISRAPRNRLAGIIGSPKKVCSGDGDTQMATGYVSCICLEYVVRWPVLNFHPAPVRNGSQIAPKRSNKRRYHQNNADKHR